MKAPIRFIHSADLHLDSPFAGSSNMPDWLFQNLRNSTFEAFDRLIETAIEHHVDFILLCGDVFDQKTRNLKTQIWLKQRMEKLAEHHIHVFMSYGNHDHTGGDYHDIPYPDNVDVFEKSTVHAKPFTKDGRTVAYIYGFSYPDQNVYENKTSEYCIEAHADYHIAMLHGSSMRSSEHEHYAPFTLTELLDCNMDYWALGHIHQRQSLSEYPPVHYSGNIQGRSRKETGEKGCYVIDLSGGSCDMRFQALQSFQYKNKELDAVHVNSIYDLEGLLKETKESLRQEQKNPVMLYVSVNTPEAAKFNQWKLEGDIEELIEIENEREEGKASWIWITHLSIQPIADRDESALSQGSHFSEELIRQANTYTEINEALAPLFRHRQARKYLAKLSDEDKEAIVKEAMQLALEKSLHE
ncbi:DNA repair exonuclease [Thalassobacillus sp. CUG 92003]|uniref:metallophosphoesterase family protein n=1 Tax=Thalassobacillus sp. CUG 92003 TaxID=2736641 RepID=UPI0015E78C83|nr:DNA repair exonuclease [Thalassobacillus sp. CUG 92003]